MNHKSKLVVLLILVMYAGLSSCVTYKRCLSRFPPSVTSDSVYIEKIKEVPVFIPGDTVNVNSPVNCPDQDIANIETTKLKQQIKILNGKLISTIQIKQDTIKVKVTETVTKTKEVKVPQPIPYIPKFYSICTWLLIGIVVAIIGYFGIKIFVLKKI